jgi:hypothetical protein
MWVHDTTRLRGGGSERVLDFFHPSRKEQVMTLVRRLSFVLVLVALSVHAREFEKPEALRAVRAMRVVSAAVGAKAVSVDCTKGKSVQAAIDANVGAVTIDIHGICVENVRIERRSDITLRGASALTDGIQGVAGGTAGLEVYHSTRVLVQNLALSNGATIGFGAWFSHVTLESCRVENNTMAGMHLSSDSGINGDQLIVSNNLARGATVQRAATFFCVGCTFANNNTAAAVATTGGLFSLLDSVVTGINGIRASTAAYGDVDCISETTAFPCSINVSGTAAQALDAEVALYATGDFSGRVQAFEHGRALLYGARQIAATGQNTAQTFSTIWLEPHFDELDVAHESSLLRSTVLEGFSRLLVQEPATLGGNVQCSSASDAWLDPGVTTAVGVTVAGCEHASVP